MTGRRSAAALVGLAIGTFAFVTVETLPIGLLDPIAHDLDVSESAVGLLVTAYALTVVVSSVPLTRLTRRVPRRTLLTTLLLLYVGAALGTATASTWSTMLLARIVTAADQALFWSIAVPVAASLFGVEVRGRVIAVVLGGAAIAPVLGVPLGTWVGQHLGWRWAFVAAAVVGAVVLALLASTPEPEAGSAESAGSAPDRRRFWVLVGAMTAATTGAFASFTYLSPYVTDVIGLSAASLSVVLVVRGLAGLVGVLTAGALTDRHPRAALAGPVAVQLAALALLFAAPLVPALAIMAIALTGYAFAGFTAPMATRAMTLAPGSVDLAISSVSTAVNVGIMLGAALGGAVVDLVGVRETALLGALLTALASSALMWDRPSRRSLKADRYAGARSGAAR